MRNFIKIGSMLVCLHTRFIAEQLNLLSWNLLRRCGLCGDFNGGSLYIQKGSVSHFSQNKVMGSISTFRNYYFWYWMTYIGSQVQNVRPKRIYSAAKSEKITLMHLGFKIHPMKISAQIKLKMLYYYILEIYSNFL